MSTPTSSKWSKHTVTQLKEELTKRGLDLRGKKVDLVQRLEESDTEQAEKENTEQKENTEEVKEAEENGEEGQEHAEDEGAADVDTTEDTTDQLLSQIEKLADEEEEEMDYDEIEEEEEAEEEDNEEAAEEKEGTMDEEEGGTEEQPVEEEDVDAKEGEGETAQDAGKEENAKAEGGKDGEGAQEEEEGGEEEKEADQEPKPKEEEEQIEEGTEQAEEGDEKKVVPKKEEEEEVKDKTEKVEDSQTTSSDSAKQEEPAVKHDEDDEVPMVELHALEDSEGEEDNQGVWKRQTSKTREDEEETDKGKDNDKETEKEEKIVYKFKEIERNQLTSECVEFKRWKKLVMKPLGIADMGRPEILECLDKCTNFIVRFRSGAEAPGDIKEEEHRTWDGMLEMDFITLKDVLEAEENLQKLGDQYKIYRMGKGEENFVVTDVIRDWQGNDDKQLVGPLTNILYTDDLPEELDESQMLAMFPEASMVTLPRKKNKSKGYGYIHFPDLQKCVKALKDRKGRLDVGKSRPSILMPMRGRRENASQEVLNLLYPEGKEPPRRHSLLSAKDQAQIKRQLRSLGDRLSKLPNAKGKEALRIKQTIANLMRKVQDHEKVKKAVFDEERNRRFKDRGGTGTSSASASKKDDSDSKKDKDDKKPSTEDKEKKDDKDKDKPKEKDAKKDSSQDKGKDKDKNSRSRETSRKRSRERRSRERDNKGRGRSRSRSRDRGRDLRVRLGRRGRNPPAPLRREGIMDTRSPDRQRGGRGIMGSPPRGMGSSRHGQDMSRQPVMPMAPGPHGLAQLVSQVGSGGASIQDLMTFMQQNQMNMQQQQQQLLQLQQGGMQGTGAMWPMMGAMGGNQPSMLADQDRQNRIGGGDLKDRRDPAGFDRMGGRRQLRRSPSPPRGGKSRRRSISPIRGRAHDRDERRPQRSPPRSRSPVQPTNNAPGRVPPAAVNQRPQQQQQQKPPQGKGPLSVPESKTVNLLVKLSDMLSNHMQKGDGSQQPGPADPPQRRPSPPRRRLSPPTSSAAAMLAQRTFPGNQAAAAAMMGGLATQPRQSRFDTSSRPMGQDIRAGGYGDEDRYSLMEKRPRLDNMPGARVSRFSDTDKVPLGRSMSDRFAEKYQPEEPTEDTYGSDVIPGLSSFSSASTGLGDYDARMPAMMQRGSVNYGLGSSTSGSSGLGLGQGAGLGAAVGRPGILGPTPTDSRAMGSAFPPSRQMPGSYGGGY